MSAPPVFGWTSQIVNVHWADSVGWYVLLKAAASSTSKSFLPAAVASALRKSSVVFHKERTKKTIGSGTSATFYAVFPSVQSLPTSGNIQSQDIPCFGTFPFFNGDGPPVTFGYADVEAALAGAEAGDTVPFDTGFFFAHPAVVYRTMSSDLAALPGFGGIPLGTLTADSAAALAAALSAQTAYSWHGAASFDINPTTGCAMNIVAGPITSGNSSWTVGSFTIGGPGDTVTTFETTTVIRVPGPDIHDAFSFSLSGATNWTPSISVFNIKGHKILSNETGFSDGNDPITPDNPIQVYIGGSSDAVYSGVLETPVPPDTDPMTVTVN